jgi:hypothetical protein
LARLIHHCFPWWWEALDAIPDPRDGPLYAMRQVLSLAVLMFACRLRSLRALDELSDDAVFRDNWCVFSRARSDTVVCSRQMTNVLAALDAVELAALRPRLIRALHRQKQLSDALLLGHLMMASDGTGIFSSSEFHCPRCLTQEHQDGSKTYLHNVLEVKVVTWSGWALSVMTEMQLNPNGGKYEKQDCESKAFKRMLPRLKQEFPQQPIVHLLDAGYCNGPMFQAIDAVHHKFICCFKPGAIPTLYQEALTLCARNPQNKVIHTFGPKRHKTVREYAWVGDLEYEGHKLDFVMCQETVDAKTTTFAWLTNFDVDEDNLIPIAQGGRLRWTIENEGFNQQKTGYELEHFCDCKDLDVMTCLYLLLQIAHLFMQLLARSDLIEPVSTLTFLAHLLLEALRNASLPDDLFDPRQPRFQIRFTRAPT